jgi:hypothetical protein
VDFENKRFELISQEKGGGIQADKLVKEWPLPPPDNEVTILFSGSQGGKDLDPIGPLAGDQTFAWLEDMYGNKILSDFWVQYPGVKRDIDGKPIPPYGKHHQALKGSTEINTGDKELNLIGYSSGADACLIYAHDQLKKGKKIKTMVLLDPTMTGAMGDAEGRILNGIYNDANDDPLWKTMLDELIKEGTDVIIVNDYVRTPDGALIDDAIDYEPPKREDEDGEKREGEDGEEYGNFYHDNYGKARPHHVNEEKGSATNNNEAFRDVIYSVLRTWKYERELESGDK